MRAIVLTLSCFVGIGATFYAPYLGILMWHWLSLMNPHRFAYGFAGGLPIIMMSAAVSLLMWIASSEPKKLPRSLPCMLLIAFMLWVTFTTPFASNTDAAFKKWTEVAKILGMTLVTIAATTTRTRLIALVWVAALSLGFWGVKGGLFVILKGGGGRVQGPTGTFIGDNNAFALALLMALPLWLFLGEIVKNRRHKLAIMWATGLIAIATLMTYSRGALLGFLVIGGIIWWSSRRRVVTAIVFVLAVGVGVQFLPEKWVARMNTIEEYDEDGSAVNRLTYWKQSIDMAAASPVIGQGFKAFLDRNVAQRFRPGIKKLEEAHSIYFQVLGEHGYVGLIIYLGLGATFLWTTFRLYRSTRRDLELFWAHRLARALMLSGVAFAVSGAFLSQAYFDFYYLLVAMAICLSRIVREGEAPPKVDNFPHLLELLRVNTIGYGLERPKPASGKGAPVPALTRG